jgi:hypothetical protein
MARIPTKLQNAGWFALFVCLVLAFGTQVWKASQNSYSEIYYQNPVKKKHSTDHKSIPERQKSEEALVNYTWWLTFFTSVLAFATIGLGIATIGLYLTGEKQIELSRKSLVATLRPKIGVRRVRKVTDLSADPFKVQFTIINTGSTNANIETARGRLFFWRTQNRPFLLQTREQFERDGYGIDLPSKVLGGGAAITVTIESLETYDGAVKLYAPNAALGVTAYLTSKIIYKDDLGNTRETSILRRFDVGEQRFYTLDDSEYEYEE